MATARSSRSSASVTANIPASSGTAGSSSSRTSTSSPASVSRIAISWAMLPPIDQPSSANGPCGWCARSSRR
nr:hypothetical protein [Micromonospora sp. 4G55]